MYFIKEILRMMDYYQSFRIVRFTLLILNIYNLYERMFDTLFHVSFTSISYCFSKASITTFSMTVVKTSFFVLHSTITDRTKV